MVEIESIAGSADMSEGGLVTFVVTYSDRYEEYRQGTLLDVSHLASTAGLHLTHATPGVFRWDSQPEEWSTDT